MSRAVKTVVWLTVVLAAAAAAPIGGKWGKIYSPAAFHVFFFNLAAGGLTILTRLSLRKNFSAFTAAFFLLSLCFAAGAFFKIYLLCLPAAFLLGLLAESFRWRRFSFFPADFFQEVPVSRKFEQAGLLCLSLGLFICAATLLNNEFLKLFHLAKLDLHVFYLGFSFPLSLLAFSTIFSRLEAAAKPPGRLAGGYCFWALNLGVIIFFFFIIFQVYAGQLVMAAVLFSVVLLTLFFHLSVRSEDEGFWWLLSALAFLVLGSATGIGYIVLQWRHPEAGPAYLLSLHSAATLFGWNLSWILIALREGDPPRRLSPWFLIGLHWFWVLFLPLARVSVPFAGFGTALFVTWMAAALFFPGREEKL